MKQQRGLTLVELLIALSLCAVLGILSYRGLSTLIDSRDHVAQTNQRWREIALFFSRLEGDLMQSVARDAQTANGKTTPGMATPSTDSFVMTRFRGDRAGVERVSYRLENSALILREWDELSLADLPNGDPVLTGVKSIRWEFLGYAADWVPRWPVDPRSANLPRAVRLTLELDDAGTLTRVFALR